MYLVLKRKKETMDKLLKHDPQYWKKRDIFSQYFPTADFTKFLSYILLYIISLFSFEKARKRLKLENTQDNKAILEDKRESAGGYLKELATLYGLIILRFKFKDRSIEQQFYETLYEVITQFLCCSFDRRLWPVVTKEIERLFRTDNFTSNSNTVQPNHQTNESESGTLGARQLYYLQTKHGYRVPKKHRSINISHLRRRTPLISTVFPRNNIKYCFDPKNFEIPEEVLYLPFDSIIKEDDGQSTAKVDN